MLEDFFRVVFKMFKGGGWLERVAATLILLSTLSYGVVVILVLLQLLLLITH